MAGKERGRWQAIKRSSGGSLGRFGRKERFFPNCSGTTGGEERTLPPGGGGGRGGAEIGRLGFSRRVGVLVCRSLSAVKSVSDGSAAPVWID